LWGHREDGGVRQKKNESKVGKAANRGQDSVQVSNTNELYKH